jgi:uncharacterized repeat protein (TIGR03803 family)
MSRGAASPVPETKFDEGIIMCNTLQKRASKLRLGAASAALALAATLGLAVSAPITEAQTFAILHNFTGAPDGQGPYAGVIEDSAGNLYGTTLVGGNTIYGSVFEVDSKGSETVLFGFNRSDGELPYAGLARDKAGNLYGTTELGGSSGLGTVFKLSKGELTTLHNFSGATGDGCLPYGGVIMDAKGNLYGTTSLCGGGYGMVWELTPAGKQYKFTLLHGFTGGAKDGSGPSLGNLLMDKKGNFYGVTLEGGSANNGTLYELSKTGKITILHSFDGGTQDGCFPSGTVWMDKAGSFYGTTEACGSAGDGVVWKVTKDKETVLHNFTDGTSDGSKPYAGVILDAQGNLYGTTSVGGAAGDGTVYELSKGGTFSLLHTFSGSDGNQPYGGLLRDSKGNLYGTAYAGGSADDGTVWKLTP